MSDHDKLREAVAYYDRIEGHDAWSFHLRLLIEHARDSLPKTKMVEVWRVEWAHPLPMEEGAQSPQWKVYAAHYRNESEARIKAHAADCCGNHCICVTGPHQQEVPA